MGGDVEVKSRRFVNPHTYNTDDNVCPNKKYLQNNYQIQTKYRE